MKNQTSDLIINGIYKMSILKINLVNDFACLAWKWVQVRKNVFDVRAGAAENPCTLTAGFHFIYFLAVNK